MKKKKIEIATNLSSGAEKVEVVEKQVKTKRENATKSAKGDAALGDSVQQEKRLKKSSLKENSTERESKAAEARVENAMKKKQEKEMKKKEGRLSAYKKYVAEENAKIEKRLAERKAKAEKHAAERKAIAEKKAAEKERLLYERARKKANKKNARSQKRSKKRTQRSAKKGENRSKGYGGWIAAVVALGVTTLALATTVTVGAVEMKEMKTSMTGAQMGTMYELTGIMEHVDDDLDRVRISVSPTQQQRILTDLLVQTRIAEIDFEKLPIALPFNRNVTEFVNRTANHCERMLAKLRSGNKLSQNDIEELDGLYQAAHAVRKELDQCIETLTDKDLIEYSKKGAGTLYEAMERLEKITLEENRAALEREKEQTDGAGMRRNNNKGENSFDSTIDATRAGELCNEYFSKYGIEEYQCVGETVNRWYSAYNMQGFDEKGAMLFAEIDRNSGELITFDYYEEGCVENFDLQNALLIAQSFLEELGYENMTVSNVRPNGTLSDFTFLYEQDGVVYYPDAVHVKVCRTRGLVCGLDATKYLKNHRGRYEMTPKISLESAYKALNERLEVNASKLAVVNTARGERLAYEFLCSFEEEQYFVYLDATTAEEIAIINVKNIQ